jgi:endonuclease/exonuclease/phosphatase family metal-dependent hydrolase
MRLLSYNILDGGTGRIDLLAQVIERQRPDVVALVEAEDHDVVEKLAGRLEMDFIHAPGNHKASALLSRFVIRETINHAPLHEELTKSFLEATVIDAAGDAVTLGVLHLHAHATGHDESIRQREIETVLRIIEPHRARRRKHLLMGDFNADAPSQQINPERCKPRTRQDWAKNGGSIPRRVVQRILDAGYTDSFHAIHPREAETTGTFSTEFPGQRVDFIFTFGIEPGRLREAGIAADPPAREASDHFPVTLEIA